MNAALGTKRMKIAIFVVIAFLVGCTSIDIKYNTAKEKEIANIYKFKKSIRSGSIDVSTTNENPGEPYEIEELVKLGYKLTQYEVSWIGSKICGARTDRVLEKCENKNCVYEFAMQIYITCD